MSWLTGPEWPVIHKPVDKESERIAARANARAIRRSGNYLPSPTETWYEAARGQESLDLFRRLRTGKSDSIVK